MFCFQVFIAISTVFILYSREGISVVGTGTREEGLFVLLISSFLSIIISQVFYLFSVSRLRFILFLFLTLISCFALFLLAYTGALSLFVLSPTLSSIIFITLFLGGFIYGTTNILYYKFKNAFFALLPMAFWHFGNIAVGISHKLGNSYVDSIDYLERLTIAWEPLYIFLIFLFLLFSVGLILIDTKLSTSRWLKNMNKESKLGLKNLGCFGFLFFLIAICTISLAPLLWQLYWKETQTRERQKIEQQQKEQEEMQKNQPQYRAPERRGQEQQPMNEDGEYDSGSSLNTTIPEGSGLPLFVVRAGGERLFNNPSSDFIQEASIKKAHTEDESEKESLYLWRSFVLDDYSDVKGFTFNEIFAGESYDAKFPGMFNYEYKYDYLSSKDIELDFLSLNLTTTQVVLLNAGKSVKFYKNSGADLPFLNGYVNGSIITEEQNPLQPGMSYTQISKRPDPSIEQLKLARAEFTSASDFEKPYYFFDFNNTVYTVTLSKVRGIQNDLDKVIAIQNFLRTDKNFEKNEENRKLTQDDIDEFIVNGEVGDVPYFTAAMVRMLSELDIDARIAGGFTQGEYIPELDVYMVSDLDMYYWVEVYFENYGWIEFNPVGEPTEKEQQRQQELEQKRQDATPQDRQEFQEQFGQPLPENFNQDNIPNEQENNQQTPEEENQTQQEQQQEEQQTPEEQEQQNDEEQKEEEIPEEKKDENYLGAAIRAMISIGLEYFKRYWLIILCLIIFLLPFIPPILKFIKLQFAKARLSQKTNAEKIKFEFIQLQLLLNDFGEEIKETETNLQFADRFVENFPVKNRPEGFNIMLREFAEIYNKSLFGKDSIERDVLRMKNLNSEITEIYKKSKGNMAYLRWFNLISLFR